MENNNRNSGKGYTVEIKYVDQDYEDSGFYDEDYEWQKMQDELDRESIRRKAEKEKRKLEKHNKKLIKKGKMPEEIPQAVSNVTADKGAKQGVKAADNSQNLLSATSEISDYSAIGPGYNEKVYLELLGKTHPTRAEKIELKYQKYMRKKGLKNGTITFDKSKAVNGITFAYTNAEIKELVVLFREKDRLKRQEEKELEKVEKQKEKLGI